MTPIELINDLVNSRGAVLEILDQKGGEPKIFLVGAFELIAPRGDEALAKSAFWFEAGKSDQSGGHVLTFASYRMLHALAVGFFDDKGELASYLTQIREAELPSDQEQLFKDGFTAWQKLLQDKEDGLRTRQFLTIVRDDLTEAVSDQQSAVSPEGN